MKNMKVSAKLLTGFLIAAFLTVIIGGAGIFGMWDINKGASSMYDNQTVPMPYMTKVIEMLQRQRACMRDMIIGASVNDMDLVEDAKNRADNYHDTLLKNLEPYRNTIKTPDALILFDEACDLYNKDFRACMSQIYNLAKSGADGAEVYSVLTGYTDTVNKIVENFDQCLDMKIEVAKNANTAGDNLFSTLLAVIIIVITIALVIALSLAFYISGIISKPLAALTGFMKKAGSTGDIKLTDEDKKIIENYSVIKDEIGQCITASSSFVTHVTYISGELERISNGDLSSHPKLLSNADTIGLSLQRTLNNLNTMFNKINGSTSQVSASSLQIAGGSQSLAQGSTEQAAAVEQLSSSISEIAEQTKENAGKAAHAADLANTIKNNAEKGSRQMDEMMSAVNDINMASKSISKVIKVIDDIAFQTNILALNAAVEAARAGQQGKGFAVVAEEVRNLAAKSAEAAKETGTLIADSAEKAKLGSRIAHETADSLTEIVSGINESAGIIADIARSSEEQSGNIVQINQGITQVAQVIQLNSATAEESAAASEEMSSQANVLEELISQFKLKDNIVN
ncbi:MAG: methyl-accepting chemotaxis protein [Oscillospiraceae bacterium]|nr:methyl-accepting chemotaxis protein [Oscillospiraceae bacterium]